MPDSQIDKNNILDATDEAAQPPVTPPGPHEAKILKQIEEDEHGRKEEEQRRDAELPARMHVLAEKNQLALSDWIEITGLGPGSETHYEITHRGVRFIGWSEDLISSWANKDQIILARQTEAPGLILPCTPQALLDFVDSGAGSIFGSFIVPDEFRMAAKAHAEVVAQAKQETESASIKAAPLTNPLPDAKSAQAAWITKSQTIAQKCGLKLWKSGVRSITARGVCNEVTETLGKDKKTWIGAKGQQGPRGKDNVRTVGLKGWVFEPPNDVK